MSQWNALVRLCAYVSATVAIARGVSVGDRESIGIGVALIVAEIATHLPWKVLMYLGWLGLAALFVNQGFWMVTAIASLTSAAPSIAGAAAPAVLSVTAVLGVIASLARLQSRAQGAVTPLMVIGTVAAVGLLVGVPLAGQDAAKAQDGDLRIVTRDVKFVPERQFANPGDVGIYVKNDDLFWHTLTIDDLDVDQRIATAGRHRIQLRDVEPGTYEFVCAIPGHESAGMTGTLVVR